VNCDRDQWSSVINGAAKSPQFLDGFSFPFAKLPALPVLLTNQRSNTRFNWYVVPLAPVGLNFEPMHENLKHENIKSRNF
jgi:hypothetical protein